MSLSGKTSLRAPALPYKSRSLFRRSLIFPIRQPSLKGHQWTVKIVYSHIYFINIIFCIAFPFLLIIIFFFTINHNLQLFLLYLKIRKWCDVVGIGLFNFFYDVQMNHQNLTYVMSYLHINVKLQICTGCPKITDTIYSLNNF